MKANKNHLLIFLCVLLFISFVTEFTAQFYFDKHITKISDNILKYLNEYNELREKYKAEAAKIGFDLLMYYAKESGQNIKIKDNYTFDEISTLLNENEFLPLKIGEKKKKDFNFYLSINNTIKLILLFCIVILILWKIFSFIINKNNAK